MRDGWQGREGGTGVWITEGREGNYGREVGRFGLVDRGTKLTTTKRGYERCWSVHTSLKPLALRLVGDEGAKLILVLLVEEIEVGLRNIHCVGSLVCWWAAFTVVVICWRGGGDVLEIIIWYQELDKQPEEVRYRRSVQLDWMPDGALLAEAFGRYLPTYLLYLLPAPGEVVNTATRECGLWIKISSE